jgi:2-polyprenyl-3-methyl-5-hydroxy-6-metoxy-1,4-benzoquinol methylase
MVAQSGSAEGEVDPVSSTYARWKTWDAETFGHVSSSNDTYYAAEIGPLLRGHRQPRVLEIGFGNGTFLGWCLSRGFDIRGIELLSELRDLASRVGVAAYSSLDEPALVGQRGEFDCIVAFDVLEHIEQGQLPAYFQAIAALLKEGGTFVARFPNGDSPFGRTPQHGDLTHVTTLGGQKIRHLATIAGLDVVALKQPEAVPGPGLRGRLRSSLKMAARRVIERAGARLYAVGSRVVPYSPNLIAVLRKPRRSTIEDDRGKPPARSSSHVSSGDGGDLRTLGRSAREGVARLRKALFPGKSPLEQKLDVVFTWVDYSHPDFCAKVFGREPTTTGDFVELKYVLRSYEALGYTRHIGRIHVVHSDLHPPPAYLRQDHPQLSFVKDSVIARTADHLPFRSKEAVMAHLHRIPDLSEWFLYSSDDIVALQPWETMSRFLWEDPSLLHRGGRPVIVTEDWSPQRYYTRAEVPWAAWLNGIVTSKKLLEERFGRRWRGCPSHGPFLISRRTMAEMEELWPTHLDRTARGAKSGHVAVDVLHNELMVDTRRAVRRSNRTKGQGDLVFSREIHTSAEDIRPPVTTEKVARLARLLADAETSAVFVNLQGPGISDEKDPTPAYHELVYGWLERRFPQRSSFEI